MRGLGRLRRRASALTRSAAPSSALGTSTRCHHPSTLAAPRCRVVSARSTAVDLVYPDWIEGGTADAALLFVVEHVTCPRPRGGREKPDHVDGKRQEDHKEGGRTRSCSDDVRDDDRDEPGKRYGQAASDDDPLGPCFGELAIIMGTHCGQQAPGRAEYRRSSSSVPPVVSRFNFPDRRKAISHVSRTMDKGGGSGA
jgi:hypothetical protein